MPGVFNICSSDCYAPGLNVMNYSKVIPERINSYTNAKSSHRFIRTYDYLTIVRRTNNIEQWIKFFLSGVIVIAETGSETFKKIIELRKIYDECTLIRQIMSTFAIMHMWTMKIF